MIKKVIFAAMLAASLGSVATPAFTAERGIRIAPPPPREEVIVERRGQVWVPGHWEYKNGKYHWKKGHLVKARRGYHYAEPRWVERDGRWYREGGVWRRGDRDGDGVPNRADRAPDNPRRY
jgi:YXWGXW repeat-containing protein